MTIQELSEKKVAVLGFGMEGKATVTWLLAHGIIPTVFDEKPLAEWSADDASMLNAKQLTVMSGPSYLESLEGFTVIFRSPGIWRLHPLLLEAEKKGASITSQARWFLEHCPARVVGVTGTKGKGTTSSLIYHIISDSIGTDTRVYLTGNIGKTQPFEILETLTERDVVVYELSSFQLQDVSRSPQYAVVLMITQDHLDQHQDITEYHEAKRNIVSHQTAEDYVVINQDYPASAGFAEHTPATIAWVSQNQKPDRGAFISEANKIFITGFDAVAADAPFIRMSDLILRGRHNLQNLSAAVLVALQMQLDPQSIQKTVRGFAGLEHRLQLVGTVNGVSYFDDSFSTVPETTIAAIEAFSEPTILILGGSDKHSDFTKLARTIIARKNIKALIIIGQTAGVISDALKQAGGFGGIIHKNARSMAHIFEQLEQVTEAGDVVVLSPACASFGMFANYKDRGEQFAAAVRALELGEAA